MSSELIESAESIAFHTALTIGMRIELYLCTILLKYIPGMSLCFMCCFSQCETVCHHWSWSVSALHHEGEKISSYGSMMLDVPNFGFHRARNEQQIARRKMHMECWFQARLRAATKAQSWGSPCATQSVHMTCIGP